MRVGAATETSKNCVVHVGVERFFDVLGTRELDELVSWTDRLDQTLRRHASGWTRPSADEAVLVTVTETPWGPNGHPLDWAGDLRESIGSDLGLDCSVGIARTRVAARICSRIARPRGVLLWLSGYEEGLIRSLSLEELDELTPEQLAKLRARGVRTLGEMSALDLEEARAILGSQAPKLLSLLRGMEGGADRAHGGRLSRGIALLSKRLSSRLVRCQRQARGLELRLSFDDGVSAERYTLLPRAVAESDTLDRAARRLLAMAPHRDRRVVGVTLTATGLTAGHGQLSLFRAGDPREVEVKMGRTMK